MNRPDALRDILAQHRHGAVRLGRVDVAIVNDQSCGGCAGLAWRPWRAVLSVYAVLTVLPILTIFTGRARGTLLVPRERRPSLRAYGGRRLVLIDHADRAVAAVTAVDPSAGSWDGTKRHGSS